MTHSERVVGVALDLFPQATEDVDGPRSDKSRFLPNRVEELVAGEKAAAMGGQLL
jgi:hypothetical protein